MHESVIRHLIMKTNIMLAVTVILAKESPSFMPSKMSSTVDIIAMLVFLCTFAALLVCFFHGLSIPHSRRWGQGPHLNTVMEIGDEYDADTSKRWLIDVNALAEQNNTAQMASIMKKFDNALYSLRVAIGGIALLVLIQVFTVWRATAEGPAMLPDHRHAPLVGA